MKRLLPTVLAVILIVLLGTFVGGAIIQDLDQNQFYSGCISFVRAIENTVDPSTISTALLLAISILGLGILGRRRSFKA